MGEINAEQGENGFLSLCTMAFASPITVTMTNASFFRIAWESAVLRSVYFKGSCSNQVPFEKRNLAMTLRLLDSQNNSFEEVL